MDGMVARTQLAALDQNFNVNRTQAVLHKSGKGGEKGESQLSSPNPKRDWVPKKRYGETQVQWETRRLSIPKHITLVERPHKAQLIKNFCSRFERYKNTG
ncbi:hypothetical protein XENTR_v10018458 [Xenopus tropicalis]|nr:hypothetical protein XENTR_v10018458 [Xenopus tropicalis]